MTQTITVDEVARDVLVIRGATLESTATAFLAADETVLVDALASVDEALAMRRHLEEQRGAQVATIVATHYMDDHVAGMAVFPEARVLAHRLFGFTHAFGHRGDGSVDGFRRPDVLIDAPIELIAGPHRLRVFGNAGMTVCMLNVDAPASKLVVAGDNLIGRIVYLSRSVPEMLQAGLARLAAAHREHVVAGHQGAFAASALDAAGRYLQTLARQVRASHALGSGWRESVLAIAVHDCLPRGLQATPFEQHWHGQNLQRVVERQLFRVSYA